MKFTKTLIKGKFVKRYKRFFADIKLNNKIVTAHCPNTGSMKGLLDENNEVFISQNDDPKRKLKYTLEIIKVKNNFIGVNTHFANKIVYHGLANNLIKELSNIEDIKPETFFDKNTRFDFLLKKNDKKIFVEVKNVTLLRDKETAEFPDTVTTRGSKHLITLIEATKKHFQTYVLFLVQIQNIRYFKIAKDLDSEYYKNFIIAKNAGVKFLAYNCKIDENQIKINKKINIIY